MVIQPVVDVSHILGHFWSHSMLNVESFNRESIIDHSFKQREVKVILVSKVIDCRA